MKCLLSLQCVTTAFVNVFNDITLLQILTYFLASSLSCFIITLQRIYVGLHVFAILCKTKFVEVISRFGAWHWEQGTF